MRKLTKLDPVRYFRAGNIIDPTFTDQCIVGIVVCISSGSMVDLLSVDKKFQYPLAPLHHNTYLPKSGRSVRIFAYCLQVSFVKP